MILLDTSGLLSALFPDQPRHKESARTLSELPIPGILSPFVLADASSILLSQRLKTVDILTLDERHFRVVRGWKNRPFRVLPADGPTLD